MSTSSEIMAKDLEKAQRARFEKAKDKYLFLADPEEAEVYGEIMSLRRDVERENEPARRPPRRRFGAVLIGGGGGGGRGRVIYDE